MNEVFQLFFSLGASNINIFIIIIIVVDDDKFKVELKSSATSHKYGTTQRNDMPTQQWMIFMFVINLPIK